MYWKHSFIACRLTLHCLYFCFSCWSDLVKIVWKLQSSDKYIDCSNGILSTNNYFLVKDSCIQLGMNFSSSWVKLVDVWYNFIVFTKMGSNKSRMKLSDFTHTVHVRNSLQPIVCVFFHYRAEVGIAKCIQLFLKVVTVRVCWFSFKGSQGPL